MLKKFVKSTLETVDELIMASVQEKIQKMEAKLDEVLTQPSPKKEETEIVTENAATAAAAAAAAATATVVDDVTTAAKNKAEWQSDGAAATGMGAIPKLGKDGDTEEFRTLSYDKTKFSSQKDYNLYRARAVRLIPYARHFNLCYETAKEALDLDATHSRTYSDQAVKDLENAYYQIVPNRQSTIEMWSIQDQENDTYMNKYFKKLQEVKEMFDVKFEQQSSTCSRKNSKTDSLLQNHQSTAIHEYGFEDECSDENELNNEAFLLEQERKKSKNVMFEAEQAEQSLLRQKEERCQQLTKEFNEKMAREMNSFENQRDLLKNGQNLRAESPETSVTSSCLPPENEIYARVTKPRVDQEAARVTEARVLGNLPARVAETGVPSDVTPKVTETRVPNDLPARSAEANVPPKFSGRVTENRVFKCRYCEDIKYSVEDIEKHEVGVHGKLNFYPCEPKLPKPTPVVQKSSEKDNESEQLIKNLVSQLAGQQFNIKNIVSKPFTGSDSKENFQNYSIFRTQWRLAENQLDQLGKTNVEKYTYLMQVLEGEAAKLITTAFIDNETYDFMLQKLDNRYQNPTLYLREVTNSLKALPKMKDTKDSLMKGITALESGWNNLKQRKLNNDQLLFMYFLQAYEPKLSPQTTKLWNTRRTNARDDKHPLGFNLEISDFFKCIHDAESYVLYSGSDNSEKQSENEQNRNKAAMFGAHASENQESQNRNDDKKCPIPGCNQKAHRYLLKCQKLQNNTPSELLKWMKGEGRDCKLCMEHHKTADCPGFRDGKLHKCKKMIAEGPRAGQECQGLHNAFLHMDVKPKKKNKVHSSSNVPENSQNDPQAQPAARPVVPQPGSQQQA